jgi:hypothetical protein
MLAGEGEGEGAEPEVSKVLPGNLGSLRAEEERIHTESLPLIEKTENLRDHLSMIHGTMAILYALAHDHANTSDDELTIQYLGLRLFNSAASSLKLAFSGYYQSAFLLVRDLFETVALLDYFRTNPNKIAVWQASDKDERIREFGPGIIRKALNERDGFSNNKRKEIYDRLSEYASHPTASGFQLLAPDGLGRIGPFLNEKYLNAWLEETVLHLVYGGAVFIEHFSHVERPVLVAKDAFREQATRWRDRYMGGKKGSTAT